MLCHTSWGLYEQPLQRFLLAAQVHAEVELIGHLRAFRHAGYSLDTEFTVERNAVNTIMRCGEGQLKRLAEISSLPPGDAVP